MARHDLKDRMLARERVANVRKHWVRCVTACNSRCVFCLDTDTPRNVYIPVEDVQREILRGRNELNADKIILSGGEASIHPNFVDLIRFSRDAGYSRIQTVTNGVMLSKREFYDQAVEAGLGEITYSIHGHTAELHDRLTGTPGAFRKLVKGMMRALREGRVIVNVDICINKQNVPYIDQIVELCLSVGVREFDLLHVIPQGAAFENRNELFYDPVEHLPRLQKVFRLNRHPNLVIWTNRFPIEFLEGLEDLIQDPHKMLDEVNGRRYQVRRYLDEGTPLECREKERCQYCFIEPFCNTADRVVHQQNTATWDVWWAGAPAEAQAQGYAGPSPQPLPYGCSYLGVATDDLGTLRDLALPPVTGLYVRLVGTPHALDAPLPAVPLILSASTVEQLDALLTATDLPPNASIEIELNQRTADWLLAQRAWLSQHLDAVRLHQPTYEYLKDTVANDVRDPAAFFRQLALPVRVSGLTACLAPETRLVEAPKLLSRELFDQATGRLSIRELARYHVIHGYRGKSLRCRGCPVNDRCEGAHINFLRDQGFARLQPLDPGVWAEAAQAQLARLRPTPFLRLRDGRPPEAVAESLPGFAPPESTPIEPLIILGQQARERRARRRLEWGKQAPPPA